MPRRKRGAEEAGESPTKATKTARTEKNKGGAKRGAKKAAATGADADFKAKALPLHLNLTHTPPTISKEENMEGKDNEQAEEHVAVAVPHDAGFIGNLTLVPTVFSTGSYGWKGNKRLTVELQDGDADTDGGKEKVQVMFTVNATVVGSKQVKSVKGKEQLEEQDDAAEEAEHVDEDPKEE